MKTHIKLTKHEAETILQKTARNNTEFGLEDNVTVEITGVGEPKAPMPYDHATPEQWNRALSTFPLENKVRLIYLLRSAYPLSLVDGKGFVEHHMSAEYNTPYKFINSPIGPKI